MGYLAALTIPIQFNIRFPISGSHLKDKIELRPSTQPTVNVINVGKALLDKIEACFCYKFYNYGILNAKSQQKLLNL